MRDDPMRCSEVANAMLEWQINRGSPLLSLREKYDYYFLGSLHTMIQMTGTFGLAVGHTHALLHKQCFSPWRRSLLQTKDKRRQCGLALPQRKPCTRAHALRESQEELIIVSFTSRLL